MKRNNQSKSTPSSKNDASMVKGKRQLSVRREKTGEDLGSMRIGKAHSMKENDLPVNLKEKK